MTTQALLSPTTARAGSPVRVVARLVAHIGRDPHLVLALAIAGPVVAIQLLVDVTSWWAVLGAALGFVAIQGALGRLGRGRDAEAWQIGRLLLALGYVALTSRFEEVEGGTSPLMLFFIPVTVSAAAISGRAAVVVGLTALGGYLLAIAAQPNLLPLARERGIALGATAILLALGTRRTVASLERAVASMRDAIAAERRRALQVRAVEDVGALLASAGPTPQSLDEVMELLVERFGYPYVSIYLGNRSRMRLGAQRGYDVPIHDFVPSTGVLGRVMRTAEPALVPDVTHDPEYLAARDRVQSLLSVPLLAGDELLGVINAETAPPVRLDEGDLATLRLVADRLSTALVLARERERLARRSAVFERLTSFSQALTATLEPATLYERIPSLVAAVVPSDNVMLTIRDHASGAFRVVTSTREGDLYVGRAITPGEGIFGRAIAAGQLTIDESVHRGPAGDALPPGHQDEELSIAAVPLIREEEVIGALGSIRYGSTATFDDLDREILPLLASQTALAIANAQLHHAATEASIRDPLTGLYNRRHLDACLDRLWAARLRVGLDERRPVAVVLFDLDHFGQFNKQYGHAAGDEILRAFARVLRERARASDLLARLGGEEFVAVLDGASRDGAVRFAEDVREALAATLIEGPHGQPLSATVSAGCSGLDREAAPARRLLEIADVGLAMAKAAGRNRVVAA